MNITLPEITIPKLEFTPEDLKKLHDDFKYCITELISDSDYSWKVAEKVLGEDGTKQLIEAEYKKVIEFDLNSIIKSVVKQKVNESITAHTSWDLDSIVTDAFNKEIAQIIANELPERMEDIKLEVCKLIKNYTVS